MKSTTSLTTITVTGSAPGQPCPLPAFTPMRALPPIDVGTGADAAMRERVRFGRLSSPLPYARQSDYTRELTEITLPAIRLHNAALTATVLPSLGGRLWSLYDHVRERELLFVNPTLQFANLGLTDAWFAGGIEWNLGSTGHWTHTSRDVHAAQIQTATGAGLRLWEWERTRDLILQVDLSLDGEVLLASTRVINPDPEPKPLYYWTNIAVPQTTGTRVLCDATHAWRTDYSGRLDRVGVPYPDSPDADISYPARAVDAADYFFESRPPGRFVAAVEPDGSGFGQTATDGLRGRKLFHWGTGSGGNRWQEWLCGAGRYAEIQAGRCTTQMEHDVIGGHQQVCWSEAFTGLQLDPTASSGEFAEATAAARRCLQGRISPDRLATHHRRWLAEHADAAPTQPLHSGSGWGGVELALRAGAAELPSAALPFPVLPGESEAALALVTADVGAFAAAPRPLIPPVSERWYQALSASCWDGEPWVRYARAVGAQVRENLRHAESEYRAAIALAESAGAQPPIGALRGRALLAAINGQDDAAELYARAVVADPGNRVLLTEACEHLLKAGEPHAVLDALASAPDLDHGRLRLLRAQASLALGDQAAARALLPDLEVADLAEGGRELTALWQQLNPDTPPPAGLDFRMQLPADPG
ncbi:MAG: DUF5107 domain-containing protein [Beutenbergiaceae bacterium]